MELSFLQTSNISGDYLQPVELIVKHEYGCIEVHGTVITLTNHNTCVTMQIDHPTSTLDATVHLPDEIAFVQYIGEHARRIVLCQFFQELPHQRLLKISKHGNCNGSHIWGYLYVKKIEKVQIVIHDTIHEIFWLWENVVDYHYLQQRCLIV